VCRSAFSVFLVCLFVRSFIIFFNTFKFLDRLAEFDKYLHKDYSDEGHHNTIREFPKMNSNMADVRTSNTRTTVAPFV